jgi:amidase
MSRGDPLALDALALSRAIRARELSCRELMQATLERIHRLNPLFNAIVNLAPDDALLRQADERDTELQRGQWRGWMHGLPQAIKDTAQAAGFPTTWGCELLQDARADEDSLYVARMKAAGCIVIGKTNMPEFGLGSHTYNTLFGVTRNAWDPALAAGGSSGGAAVALAQRMVPVADGSDFMGSLRNPAGWNNVFGLRPSAGRVPAWPRPEVWVSQLGTDGPMAHTVADLAALLRTQAGHDARVPLSLDDALPEAIDPASLRGLRIGWLGDLQGHLTLEPGILEACERTLARLEAAGAIVEPVGPHFSPEEVWQAWLVWRRALVAPAVAAVLGRPDARERIKPEALWEHDTAQGLTFAEFFQASAARSRFHAEVLRHFDRHDLLALPVSQVWPFDVAKHWPQQIAGRAMDTYHRWMEVTLYATFAGAPALSMPAGFDAAGRVPMGLQLIAAPRADARLLQIAAACEPLLADWLDRRAPEPGNHP